MDLRKQAAGDLANALVTQQDLGAGIASSSGGETVTVTRKRSHDVLATVYFTRGMLDELIVRLAVGDDSPQAVDCLPSAVGTAEFARAIAERIGR